MPYASFGDPQTLNLYAYVENAPMNRVDADGHAGQTSESAHWTNQSDAEIACDGDQACITHLHEKQIGSEAYKNKQYTTDADKRNREAARAAQQQSTKPGPPEHLEKVGDVKFPNEEAVETYQVKDQYNRPTGVGDTITEHVTVTDAANTTPTLHTSHDVSINKASLVIDIIGPYTPNHQEAPGTYYSVKTLQTFTVSDGKHTYVLTTKIQQFSQVQDGKVTQAGSTVLVP